MIRNMSTTLSRQQRYQLEHKLKGLCRSCSRPVVPGYVHCEVHKGKFDEAKARAANRKRLYGLTQDQYDALLASQKGVCAVCRTKPEETFHVDHCHKSGKVRGLLCRKCNIAAGGVHDDPKIATALAAYLSQFSQS